MPPGISPQIDLFAILILLGIAQGFFLAFFFFTSPEGNRLAHRILGFLLLALALSITEVLLCYTNYMFLVLPLIDTAEPLNFTFAPLLFLYGYAGLYERLPKYWYLHLLPFAVYLIYISVIFIPQEYNEKWNSYIGAYHYPHIPYREAHPYWHEFYFLKHNINELTAIQMVIYTFITARLVYQAFVSEKIEFWSNQSSRLSQSRNLLLQIASIGLIFIIIRSIFSRDSGDHLIAAHVTFVIYLVNVQVIRQSLLFQNEKSNKKYEKSSLTPEIQTNTLQKLQELMQKEKPFLQSDFSLPLLAQQLKISSHHLSQILNEQLKQNFFEYMAQYRIEEARKLLQKPENQVLKIEEIAEMVGYNSKSAFNTAFKKIVGQTPSEFKKGLHNAKINLPKA